jgi:hypothetical protein
MSTLCSYNSKKHVHSSTVNIRHQKAVLPNAGAWSVLTRSRAIAYPWQCISARRGGHQQQRTPQRNRRQLAWVKPILDKYRDFCSSALQMQFYLFPGVLCKGGGVELFLSFLSVAALAVCFDTFDSSSVLSANLNLAFFKFVVCFEFTVCFDLLIYIYIYIYIYIF